MSLSYSYGASTLYYEPSNRKEYAPCLHWFICMTMAESSLSEIDLSQSWKFQINIFLDVLNTVLPRACKHCYLDDTLLAHLYLENILRQHGSPSCRLSESYNAMFDVYEFWFLPLVANIPSYNRKFIGTLANKLAFVTGLTLHSGRSRHSNRKLGSRCLYYLGQYALCQDPNTERDHSISIALAAASRCLEVSSREGQSSYGAF
jgi:hypothetical protein